MISPEKSGPEKSSNVRQAIVAVQLFAHVARRRYEENVGLLRAQRGAKAPWRDKLRAFDTAALTEAQTYADQAGAQVLILAHLDGANVDFSEMEALTGLANDASVFDGLAANPVTDADERLFRVAVLHGERAIARAIFLDCLLGGYLRALDANLFQRAMSGEKDLAVAARPLSQQSADAFIAALEPIMPRFAAGKEIVAYARAMQFPLLPLVIGHKKDGAEILNGVAMSPDLAAQFRAFLARQQAQAAAKRK